MHVFNSTTHKLGPVGQASERVGSTGCWPVHGRLLVNLLRQLPGGWSWQDGEDALCHTQTWLHHSPPRQQDLEGSPLAQHSHDEVTREIACWDDQRFNVMCFYFHSGCRTVLKRFCFCLFFFPPFFLLWWCIYSLYHWLSGFYRLFVKYAFWHAKTSKIMSHLCTCW